MQTDSSAIYRCKQCSASFQRRDQLQPHLHWHHITDPNIDRYFATEVGVDSETPPATAAQSVETLPRKREPSLAVLAACIAILGVLGLAAYLSN